MPVLHVLIDENGDVLGTARVDIDSGPTSGAPVRASMVAGPGQRVMAVTVDDDVAAYEPAKLHTMVRALQSG